MLKIYFWKREHIPWAYGGLVALLLSLSIQIWLNIKVVEWFGSFYDMLQAMLSTPGSHTATDFWQGIASFAYITLPLITLSVGTEFGVRKWMFRYRTAMQEHYTSHWSKFIQVENAGQRIQDDTMRITRMMETFGVGLLQSVGMLIAFIPILAVLSGSIENVPLFGHLDYSLVWAALASALFGTAIIGIVGRRLPGLNYKNQVVEANFRKEMVINENNEGTPNTKPLWTDLAAAYRDYFREYLIFDTAKWFYIQLAAVYGFIVLGPSIIAGAITFGFIMQVLKAFDKVETSMLYLLQNWNLLVEGLSIIKRLKELDKEIG